MFSMAIMTQNKSADTTSRSNCGHTTSSIIGESYTECLYQ